MRQFDVYPNPSTRGAADRPYVVVVQSDLLDLSVRVVVPLVVQNKLTPVHRLTLTVEVEGRRFYFHPTEIASLPIRSLRNRVTNLESDRYRLLGALDLVFTGV